MTLTDAVQGWIDTMRAIDANDATYRAETAGRGRATMRTLREGERLARRLSRMTRAWERAAEAHRAETARVAL